MTEKREATEYERQLSNQIETVVSICRAELGRPASILSQANRSLATTILLKLGRLEPKEEANQSRLPVHQDEPESRCTGACCRGFVLTYPPDELARRAHHVIDGEFIADMVIYLGTTNPHTGEEHSGHYYTCKHHDTVSGDCRVYEQRPRMCRDYPCSRACEFPGCTYRPAAKNDESKRMVDEATIKALRAAFGGSSHG